MPEDNECQIFPVYLSHSFKKLRTKLGKPDDWEPALQRLLFHWSKKEISERRKAGILTREQSEGRIFELTPASEPFVRGPKSAQSPIFPPMLGLDSPDLGFTLQDLRLKGFGNTSRSVIVDLGRLALQLQPLTHTSPQLYTAQDWKAIEETPRFKYGKNPEHRMLNFHVGLALDFGEFVIAFVSHDLLFRPTWFSGGEWLNGNTPYQDPVDVLHDFSGYMSYMTRWVTKSYPRLGIPSKNATILSFMHKHDKDLFPGIGQYSRSEVLLRAGLNPELTVHEVIECRSRLYRLILAVLEFKMQALNTVWPEYVRAFVRDYMLAPTVKERLKLSNVLYTFAKLTVSSTQRLKQQIEAYNQDVTNKVPREQRCDPFEPTLIQNALRYAPEFGPAILGDTLWKEYGGEAGTGQPHANPLVENDKKKGVFLSSSHLVSTSGWTSLFIPSRNARTFRVKNRLYKYSKALKVWTPILGEQYKPESDNDTDSYGFRNIVQSKNKVVVMMGEFAGSAFPLKLSSSREGKPVYRAIPSYGVIPADESGQPVVQYSIASKGIIETIARITEFNRQGSKHVSLTKDERKLRDRRLAAFDTMWNDRFGAVSTLPPLPPPDAALLAEDGDDFDDSDSEWEDEADRSDDEEDEEEIQSDDDVDVEPTVHVSPVWAADSSEDGQSRSSTPAAGPPASDFSDYQSYQSSEGELDPGASLDGSAYAGFSEDDRSSPDIYADIVKKKRARREKDKEEHNMGAQSVAEPSRSSKRVRKERGIPMNEKVHPTADPILKRSYTRRKHGKDSDL